MADTHERGYPKEVLTPDQVYAAALQAGFRGQDAIMITAIAGPESGDDAHVLNDTPSTGDLSYGLTQINMLGGLGPERRRQLGLTKLAKKRGIDPKDTRAVNALLYDPTVNLAAAYEVSGHGATFKPWSTYIHGTYASYLPAARAAAERYARGEGAPAPAGMTVQPVGLIDIPGQVGKIAEDAAHGRLGDVAGDVVGDTAKNAVDPLGLGGKIAGKVVDKGVSAAEKAAAAAASMVADAFGAVFDPLFDDVADFAVKAGFAMLGVTLVGAGLYQAFKPQIKAARGAAVQGAAVAALA